MGTNAKDSQYDNHAFVRDLHSGIRHVKSLGACIQHVGPDEMHLSPKVHTGLATLALLTARHAFSLADATLDLYSRGNQAGALALSRQLFEGQLRGVHLATRTLRGEDETKYADALTLGYAAGVGLPDDINGMIKDIRAWRPNYRLNAWYQAWPTVASHYHDVAHSGSIVWHLQLTIDPTKSRYPLPLNTGTLVNALVAAEASASTVMELAIGEARELHEEQGGQAFHKMDGYWQNEGGDLLLGIKHQLGQMTTLEKATLGKIEGLAKRLRSGRKRSPKPRTRTS